MENVIMNISVTYIFICLKERTSLRSFALLLFHQLLDIWAFVNMDIFMFL